MRLKDILNEKCIDLNLQGTDKYEIIRNLVKLLVKQNLVTNENEFYKAVIDREKHFSTGIGMGIAIPHAKSRYVIKPAIAFGKSETGIDFDSIDGKLANIFFLLAVPEDCNNIHLKILSELSRKLIHDDVRIALQSADTVEKIYRIFGDVK